MTAISILVPTRGRPMNAKRMLFSLYNTAEAPGEIDVLFYLDNDDPTVQSYRDAIGSLIFTVQELAGVTLVVDEPISISKSWNVLAEQAKGDILVMGNDDQVYITPGWDARLKEEAAKHPDGVYCLFFNDGLNGPRHCAFPMLSRRWVETLGYFTPGIFEFLCNDTWAMDIAKRLDRLIYIPDVLVEHRHHSNNKGPVDETYRRNFGKIRRDEALFARTERYRQADADALRGLMTRQTGETEK